MSLQVTESHRERVSGIRGLGDFGHAQERADHKLHLALIGVAVAPDRGFHLAWRVAVNGQSVLRGGEQDHAADFRETQCGADIQRRKNGLDSHYIGDELVDETAKEGVNILESRARRFLSAFGGNAQGAVMQALAIASLAFDDGVAGRSGGRGIHP